MNIFIVALAILVLVIGIAWGKIHPFLAFLFVSIGAAIALGMPLAIVATSVRKGIGDILGSLLVVIVTGAMLGKLVVSSGAAERIAFVLVARFGRTRIPWAMATTGLLVGIPLFYGVGFVLMVPIIFTIVARYRLPAIAAGLPALAAMSVAHGLLPPHPAPTALVAQLDANIGLTLLYGFMIAIPAIVIAGPLFSRTLVGIASEPMVTCTSEPIPEELLPGVFVSIFSSLLPAVLLVVTSLLTLALPASTSLGAVIRFISEPDIVMLLALATATWILGLARGTSISALMKTYTEAGSDVATILLVIAGSGVLKEVLVASGVSVSIAQTMQRLPIDPLVLGWLVAAIIRACVGSATVAGLTAAGLLVPVVANADIDPNLMVLSIGAGSLAFSHVNDGAFWLFKEYFRVSLFDTLRTWSVMETIVSLVGLAGVLLLDQFLSL